jgi:hypothetical protein
MVRMHDIGLAGLIGDENYALYGWRCMGRARGRRTSSCCWIARPNNSIQPDSVSATRRPRCSFRTSDLEK